VENHHDWIIKKIVSNSTITNSVKFGQRMDSAIFWLSQEYFYHYTFQLWYCEPHNNFTHRLVEEIKILNNLFFGQLLDFNLPLANYTGTASSARLFLWAPRPHLRKTKQTTTAQRHECSNRNGALIFLCQRSREVLACFISRFFPTAPVAVLRVSLSPYSLRRHMQRQKTQRNWRIKTLRPVGLISHYWWMSCFLYT
jgi:hypothetical protein